MLMKRPMRLIVILFITTQANADSRTHELLTTLNTQQPVYVMRDEDYKIDPKILKNSHVIGWVTAPLVDVSRSDYVGYKRPVAVEMTVIAATGVIAKTVIQQSSGSKKVDRKVQQALALAQLEKIPFADANLIYQLQQKFDIEKPL